MIKKKNNDSEQTKKKDRDTLKKHLEVCNWVETKTRIKLIWDSMIDM